MYAGMRTECSRRPSRTSRVARPTVSDSTRLPAIRGWWWPCPAASIPPSPRRCWPTGLRRGRRHHAALRPRRGDPPQGRLLRRPGHPRRPRRRRPARHPALCARLREPLPRGGDRGIRRRLLRGETPIPCVALQPDGQVPRPVRRRARSGRRLPGDRPLCRRRDDGQGGPALHRAADPDRDQSYFLFATTREQLSVCAFRSAALPKPEVRALAAGSASPSPTSRTARTSASCPRAATATWSSDCGRRRAAPGDIVHIDGRVLGRHDGVIHYTVGQRRGLNIAVGEPLYVVRARRAAQPGRSSARARRWPKPGSSLRDVNWIGDRPSLLTAPADGLLVCARVRSTRPAAPALLSCRRREVDVRRARERRRPRAGLRALRVPRPARASAGRRLHRRILRFAEVSNGRVRRGISARDQAEGPARP